MGGDSFCKEGKNRLYSRLCFRKKELGDTGRILVRESGTEPVVRVMVEAESEEICQKHVDMVVNVIKENGYVAG